MKRCAHCTSDPHLDRTFGARTQRGNSLARSLWRFVSAQFSCGAAVAKQGRHVSARLKGQQRAPEACGQNSLRPSMTPTQRDTMDDAPIERWIAESRNGSTVALGNLLSFYQGFLLTLAIKNTSLSLRAKFDPADLVQSTALEAHLRFGDFRGNTRHQLTNWLSRILKHQAIDAARYYKKSKRRNAACESSLEASPELVASLGTGQLAPDEEFSSRERIDRVQEAIQKLPQRMRNAITMRNLKQLKYGEIGVQLGCSSEAARKLCSRAASRLRRDLVE